jgi:hypothetical protein
VLCDMIQIERKFWIVTNWNLNDSRGQSPGPAAIADHDYSSANSLRQPIECLIRFSRGFGDLKRIEKNRDCGVSRREFDDAGNICILEPPKCAEDFAESLLRCVFKSVADTHDQRRISKRRNFHWCTNPGQEQKMRSARSHRFYVDLNRDILADT